MDVITSTTATSADANDFCDPYPFLLENKFDSYERTFLDGLFFS